MPGRRHGTLHPARVRPFRTWADLLWRVGLALALYPYLGYPLLLGLLGRLCRHAPAAADDAAILSTSAAIIIPAHNEAAVIEHKLSRLLALVEAEAPGSEVIVVCDGSTDGTAELARRWERRGARLVRLPRRAGKAAALNAGVAASRGELLVFSDANAIPLPGALRHLLRHFQDPRVGVVSGAKRIIAEPEAVPSPQESWYWCFEDLLKWLESRLGAIAGVDGALMAVRRAAWQPLPDDRASQDFFPALRAALAGWRLVYEPAAVALEHAAPSLRYELSRKDRTLGGGLVAIWRCRRLLGPRHPLLAWMLLSHRLLRFTVLPALVATLVGAARGRSRLARPLLAAQLVAYLVALGGWVALRLGWRPPSLLLAPGYFLAVHLATLRGIAWALRPRTEDLWVPIPRREALRTTASLQRAPEQARCDSGACQDGC